MARAMSLATTPRIQTSGYQVVGSVDAMDNTAIICLKSGLFARGRVVQVAVGVGGDRHSKRVSCRHSNGAEIRGRSGLNRFFVLPGVGTIERRESNIGEGQGLGNVELSCAIMPDDRKKVGHAIRLK
jgi:hypothetical protein